MPHVPFAEQIMSPGNLTIGPQFTKKGIAQEDGFQYNSELIRKLALHITYTSKYMLSQNVHM